MNNKIYNLLNKYICDIDSSEQLSKQEVNDLMNRFRNETSSANTTKEKKHKIRASLIIAVATAACIGTTAYAAEKLGAFDKLRNINERTVTDEFGGEHSINKFEHKDYDAIANNAQVLDEPVVKENENISINVDSIYCDGRTIILGITGSLANGNPDGWGYINLCPIIKMNGRSYGYMNGLTEMNGYMVIDEGTQNSFTGSMTFMLDESERLTEPTDITVVMTKIICSETYFAEQTTISTGESFDITVEPDTTLADMCNIIKSEDGFTATIYDISPAMITVGCTYPIEYDLNTETIPYEEPDGRILEVPKYAIVSMWYDADGNLLKSLEITVDMGEGVYAGCIEPPTTDSVIVKFCNKQQKDENGMPIVIKEMTVDLT